MGVYGYVLGIKPRKIRFIWVWVGYYLSKRAVSSIFHIFSNPYFPILRISFVKERKF